MIKIGNDVVEVVKFPNNEIMIKNHYVIIEKNIKDNKINVKFKFEDNSSLIELYLFTNDLIENYKHSIDFFVLEILYMPYSRMDRGNDTTCFSLQYITKFINDLGYNSVVIFEPHSSKSIELLREGNNLIYENYYTPLLLSRFMNDYKFNKKEDCVLFPDKGAYERYNSNILSNCIDTDTIIMIGDKKRNFDTGRIENLEIFPNKIPDEDIEIKRCVIVDDLCSYGGTFKLAILALEEMGIYEVYLIVGHCEDNILDGGLLDMESLKKVFTTNSIISEEYTGEKLDIMKVI